MNSSKRLLSLDVFRGLTIAAMILVNNPGSWSTVYSPLLHADWHGCTPTDLVFPFFLFILGVAIPYALGKRLENNDNQWPIIQKILTRSAIIFGLGLFLAAFPHFGIDPKMRGGLMAVLHYVAVFMVMIAVLFKEIYNEYPRLKNFLWVLLGIGILEMVILGWGIYDFSRLRIPGVLQRIALVYLACGIIFLKTDWRKQLYILMGLLLLYWGLMTLIPVPGGYPPNLDPETNLGAWFDRTLLGNHLWSQSKTWDPEGLLSTLPAIGTGLLGVLTGHWLRQSQEEHTAYQKVAGMMVFGAFLIGLGLFWNLTFPINKKIWTSSYVLYSGGIGITMLGITYWLVDIQGYKKWIKPFVVFGTNAIFAYVLSGIIAKLFYSIKWTTDGDTTVTLGGWLYQNIFLTILPDYPASLAYAIMNVLLVYTATLWLYRNKVFIKV